jgi:vancomycin resistance protein YoaR
MASGSVQDERATVKIVDAAPPAPRTRRARRFRRTVQIAGIVVGVVVALLALEQLVFYNRILPGVHVDGADVDMQTEGSARAKIDARAARLESEPIVANFENQVLTIDPAAIDLRVDRDATTQAARDTGRDDLNALEILRSPFERLTVGEDVPMRITWDRDKVRAVLEQWEGDQVTRFTPGDVTFSGTTVTPVIPAEGVTVDADAALAPVEDALASGTRAPVELPTKPVEPVLTEADVQRVAEQARAILSAPYEIVQGTTVVAIPPEQVAPALVTMRAPDGTNLALAVDPAKLAAAVGDAAAPFAVAPVDARFQVVGGAPVVVPSQDGRALDFAALGTPILAGQRRIEAPLAPVVPARNTAWAEGLGIKELVSTFTTEHACCASRVTNIHRAADLMQDYILEPGQTFSLNDVVGPRTVERGFVEAPVFYRMFTTDVGGGVSQLSTTVFNAAWWGGFEIVEHQPHSIWITRYPAGREATLNYGTIDNKFKNNSQHAILIHTSYTGTSITVSIYGDKEGKVVREENREVTSGRQAAGAPFVVEFDRVIEQPGQPQVREHYRWRYQQAPPD